MGAWLPDNSTAVAIRRLQCNAENVFFTDGTRGQHQRCTSHIAFNVPPVHIRLTDRQSSITEPDVQPYALQIMLVY